MNHLERDALNAYLDAELERTEEEALEAHLAECAECAARFERVIHDHTLAGDLVRELDTQAPAAPAWETLVARAEQADEPVSPEVRSRSIPWTPVLAWAATLVLAFVVGWQANEGAVVDPVLSPRSDAASEPEVAGADAADRREMDFADAPAVAQGAAEDLVVAEVTPPAAAAPPPAAEPVPTASTQRFSEDERANLERLEEMPPERQPVALERRLAAPQEVEDPDVARRQRVAEELPPQAGEWEVMPQPAPAAPEAADDGDAGASERQDQLEDVDWIRVDMEVAQRLLRRPAAALPDREALSIEVALGRVLVPAETLAVRQVFMIDGTEVELVEQISRDRASIPERRAELDGMPLVGPQDEPLAFSIRAPDAAAAPYTLGPDGGSISFSIEGRDSVLRLRARLSAPELRALGAQIR